MPILVAQNPCVVHLSHFLGHTGTCGLTQQHCFGAEEQGVPFSARVLLRDTCLLDDLSVVLKCIGLLFEKEMTSISQ